MYSFFLDLQNHLLYKSAMVDFKDIIENGLLAYRQHGVKDKRKPYLSEELEGPYPRPNSVKYNQLSNVIGIPGFELEILWDFIISDDELSHQLLDIFLQAKLSYDGTDIHDKQERHDTIKKDRAEQYKRDYEAWVENQKLMSIPDRELERALRELISYAKKFDPNAPATAAMMGIVFSIAILIDKSNNIFEHSQYSAFLKSVDWSVVDKAISSKTTDIERQKVFCNAKGRMCQMKKDVYYPSVSADILLLPGS